MPDRSRLALILALMSVVIGGSCARRVEATGGAVPRPVFAAANPQSVFVYSADPEEPWNRIFRVLFTATVQIRVSDAFPEHVPFDDFYVRMGSFPIRLSRMPYSRFELGDRAIEPVYPAFFTYERPRPVLDEQAFTELSSALRLAIDETKKRSPVERALMQADVWAVFDIIYEKGIELGDVHERKPVLLGLLRRFIRKLALTSEEIKALKNNYLAAVDEGKLPNLFSVESGWLEIELLPHRSHEDAANYRRAARVFVKPRTKPADPGRFVESLKHHKRLDQVEAVALVVQNLLLDTSGRAVPSPLFAEVQFRFFKKDAKTGAISAEPQHFELSRRKLLTEPETGGLVEYSPSSPAFLAAAGNDYEFASKIDDAGYAVMVPLHTRCMQCHGQRLAVIMTYSIHYFPPVPRTRLLNPLDQERARYVARQKEKRNDFKSFISGR